MPLYDYWCEKCFKWFEALRLMKDSDKPLKCKYCKRALKRIFIKPTLFRVN